MAELADIQKYADKEAIIHLVEEDGSVSEHHVTILKATVAGVAYKEKGKGDVKLTTPEAIYEIGDAPVKEKSVSQRKVDLVAEGSMRQHLADRHGIELAWCKQATEAQAVEFHNGLDHSKLGHVHVDKKAEKEKQEAEKNAAAEAPAEPAPTA